MFAEKFRLKPGAGLPSLPPNPFVNPIYTSAAALRSSNKKRKHKTVFYSMTFLFAFIELIISVFCVHPIIAFALILFLFFIFCSNWTKKARKKRWKLIFQKRLQTNGAKKKRLFQTKAFEAITIKWRWRIWDKNHLPENEKRKSFNFSTELQLDLFFGGRNLCV